VQVIVSIDVDDLDRAVRFYADGLGFTLQRHLFGGSVAELSSAATLVYLLAKPASSPPFPGSSEVRRYSRHWTPVHLDLVVPDIEAAVARAEAAGARLEHGIQLRDGWREAQLSDPFGHGFCLLEGWPP
jgi:catechol 2,3-dioxygenase-like lactoylglutathione lyase family enzyme